MLTALTIALTLEAANSLDVIGASARYRIYIEQTDNNGVELFVAGTALALVPGSRLPRFSSDALYDTIAMNLVQIRGNALRVPYFQCDDNFRSDTALEGRVRQDFGRLTNTQLEQELQRFMVVDGFAIGRHLGPLQPGDRIVLMLKCTPQAAGRPHGNGATSDAVLAGHEHPRRR